MNERIIATVLNYTVLINARIWERQRLNSNWIAIESDSLNLRVRVSHNSIACIPFAECIHRWTLTLANLKHSCNTYSVYVQLTPRKLCTARARKIGKIYSSCVTSERIIKSTGKDIEYNTRQSRKRERKPVFLSHPETPIFSQLLGGITHVNYIYSVYINITYSVITYIHARVFRDCTKSCTYAR